MSSSYSNVAPGDGMPEMREFGMLTSWPLVGRSREVEWLADVLAGGDRFAVVLAGRAGVGKTRLAWEWLAVAEAQGRVTARVKAGQSARRLPFGALAPLLPGASSPSMEPADMLRRARDDIVALGGGRPLVLLVDDAHLLDDASATLVHQLVASRSAFVIATVRTEEPAPDPIVALWKDELAERLELNPLAPCSIEALLSTVLDGPVSGATLHGLGERSAGNALYLRELVLAGIESGDLTNQDGIWRLSGSPAVSSRLVELIEARLGTVKDPERIVLEALAFGEPLGVGCLKTLTTARRLEELEARGLIVTGYDGRRLEARLGHPLYGEVIRARIPALRSQTIRQGLADRLHAVGARRREDALRFATWRLDAGGDMAPDLMVAAALTARNRWDLDLARRLADAAVRAGAGIDAALLQAEVAVLQGRGADAERYLAALLPLATNDAQRARVVAARVEYLVSRLGQIDEAVQVAGEAEGLLTDPGALDLVIAKRAFALQAERPAPGGPRRARAGAGTGRGAGPGLRLVGRRRVPGPHRSVRGSPGVQREMRRARRRPDRLPAAQPVAAPDDPLRRTDRRRPAAGGRAGRVGGLHGRSGQRVQHRPGHVRPVPGAGRAHHGEGGRRPPPCAGGQGHLPPEAVDQHVPIGAHPAGPGPRPRRIRGAGPGHARRAGRPGDAVGVPQRHRAGPGRRLGGGRRRRRELGP